MAIGRTYSQGFWETSVETIVKWTKLRLENSVLWRVKELQDGFGKIEEIENVGNIWKIGVLGEIGENELREKNLK